MCTHTYLYIYPIYKFNIYIYHHFTHTYIYNPPTPDALLTVAPGTLVGICGLLPHVIKNHSPKNQSAMSCQSLAKTSHTHQGS